MGLLSIIEKLTKANTQLAVTKPIALTAATTYFLFDNLTASANEIGDNFIKKDQADEDEKVLNFEEYKKELLNEYDIGFWENLFYEVKDFFADQDIISKVEKEYNITEEDANIERYKESARMYFRELIGDTTGKSLEEIEKLYQEAEKTFILQITHAPKERREIWNRVMPSVISELKAESRAKLAEDFMQLSESKSDGISRAMGLLENADDNLTQKDALGETPDIDIATAYHSAYNQGIDEIGARIAIASTDRKASEFDIEQCKQLQAIKANGGILSPEEEELLTKYENLVLASYAGSMTGLPANSNLCSDFVNSCLEDVNQSLLTYNIQNEVFKAVYSYTNSHPEFAETVANIRGTSFEEIMDGATGGSYIAFCQSYSPTEGSDSSIDAKSSEETTVRTAEEAPNVKSANTNDQSDENYIDESNTLINANPSNSYISNPFITQTEQSTTVVNPSAADAFNNKGSENASAIKQETIQGFIPRVINSYEESVEFINNTEGSIHAIVIGKVKVNPAADHIVINKFKCLDNTQKAELLGNATESWYEELKKHTPNLAVIMSNYLASGNKGCYYDRTQNMEKIVKEYKEDKTETFDAA